MSLKGLKEGKGEGMGGLEHEIQFLGGCISPFVAIKHQGGKQIALGRYQRQG